MDKEKTIKDNIYVVSVTYGNRFRFLKQVIEGALKEGVCKVIVVDNNSVKESRDKLVELERNNPKIKVIYLPENTGSAGGYKRGLKEAYNDSGCEFIWLLDDDNVPECGALNELLRVWNNIHKSSQSDFMALLSLRKALINVNWIKAISKKDPNLVFSKPGSFNGFYITNIITKIQRILLSWINPKHELKVIENKIKSLKRKNVYYGQITFAPYGGLFIHKNIIEKIGLPDEKLFLYADDLEWTHRIIKLGGEIFLCINSLIDDIDLSWGRKNKISLQIHALLADSTDDFRVYYGIRNNIYLEEILSYHKHFMYKINKSLYIGLLKILSILHNRNQRYNLIVKAVKDGETSNLEKLSENFTIV